MELWLIGALFSAGILALVWGGNAFVTAASWIAQHTGIPKFVVGATIVSLATTLPELCVSMMATMDGAVDLAIGNAVGSVSANIGLIMGISILFLPAKLEDHSFWSKGAVMIASTAFLGAFIIDGRLGLLESGILMFWLVVFIRLNLRSMKEAQSRDTLPAPARKGELLGKLAQFGLGLAGILIGANLLVDNGSRLALAFGVPEALVGLTFVAVGTSLPELITTLTALVKREPSLSVGNILGANIIDMTMILSSCALISGGTLRVNPQTSNLDLPVCLLLMLIAVIPAVLKRKFSRWQGCLLLVLYGCYVAYLYCWM